LSHFDLHIVTVQLLQWLILTF